jgi:hypothetical protein
LNDGEPLVPSMNFFWRAHERRQAMSAVESEIDDVLSGMTCGANDEESHTGETGEHRRA